MNSSLPSLKELNSAAIVEVFDSLFLEAYDTCLCGGASEPLYEPASGDNCAVIRFRNDYPSSALHEVAHWCIAGSQRRSRIDYGYWYDADGRAADAQIAFMRAEARPQAIEWYFSLASGLRFRLSLDNLDAPPDPAATRSFAEAVCAEASRLRIDGLPPRATRFFEGLAAKRRVHVRAKALTFSTKGLL